MKGIVYGATYAKAKEQLEQIIKDYESVGIVTYRVNELSGKMIVDFVNGDNWIAISTNASVRGYMCNIAYIDDKISHSIINLEIMPAIKALPYRGYYYY
jgi:hypothetical protein